MTSGLAAPGLLVMGKFPRYISYVDLCVAGKISSGAKSTVIANIDTANTPRIPNLLTFCLIFMVSIVKFSHSYLIIKVNLVYMTRLLVHSALEPHEDGIYDGRSLLLILHHPVIGGKEA